MASVGGVILIAVVIFLFWSAVILIGIIIKLVNIKMKKKFLSWISSIMIAAGVGAFVYYGVSFYQSDIERGGTGLKKENVQIRIIKNDIKIEKVESGEQENYKISIPIFIDGTLAHKQKLSVSFDFTDSQADAVDRGARWAEFGERTRVAHKLLTVKKGTSGRINCEMYTDDYDDFSIYGAANDEYYICAVCADDDFYEDHYVIGWNPYFENKRREEKPDELHDFEPPASTGDARIDAENITIETEDSKHYKLTVPIINCADNPVNVSDIRVGCNYDYPNSVNDKDCLEAFSEVLYFSDGCSFDFDIEKVTLNEKEEISYVSFDLTNRYYKESPFMGEGLDWFQCIWVCLGIDDADKTNNYAIIKNPFFDETHYFYENRKEILDEDIYKHDLQSKINAKRGEQD